MDEPSQESQQTASQVMQGTVKSYLECRRWLTFGPLQTGLTDTEKDYLLCLGAYENNPNIHISQTALSRIFSDPASSVSTTLTRMKGMGLLETSASEKDKRKLKIDLTDKGRRAYEGLCVYLQLNIKDNAIDRKD